MGYRPSAREDREVAEFAFGEEHRYHGAIVEVYTDGVSVDFALSFADMDNEPPARRRELLRQFGDTALKSWNVEDRDGNPVPATGEGMLTQESKLVWAIIGQWLEIVTSADAPLAPPSKDGESEESKAGQTTRVSRRRSPAPSSEPR